jgi:hypothetical protein
MRNPGNREGRIITDIRIFLAIPFDNPRRKPGKPLPLLRLSNEQRSMPELRPHLPQVRDS